MNYNLLNYLGIATIIINPFFSEIISSVNLDIIAVQEMTSQEGMVGYKHIFSTNPINL